MSTVTSKNKGKSPAEPTKLRSEAPAPQPLGVLGGEVHPKRRSSISHPHPRKSTACSLQNHGYLFSRGI